MGKQSEIKELWHLVYDLTHGPGSSKQVSAGIGLVNKFDEDLRNDITALSSLEGERLKQAVEDVRAKINLFQATGVFGDRDVERVNALLDKISQ